MRATISLIVLAAAGGACGSPAVVSVVVVRDSAGIEIVESQGPQWAEGEGWTLSPEPVLEIGVAEGDDPYILDRVTDALRLPDGTVIIAHAGDNTLRYYDRTGSHLRSVGGQGGGPEEFAERVSGLHRLGDSVLVWQFALQPSKVFDREGNFIRASRTPSRPSRIDAVFADGSHMFTPRVGAPSTGADVVLDSLPLYLSDFDFTDVDSVRLPAWRSVIMRPFGFYLPQVYGPRRAVAAGNAEWFYGWPETYEFRVMNRDASVRRIVRRAWEPIPVTDADRSRFRTFRLGPDTAAARAMPRKLVPVESMVYPEHHAAFRRIEVDPSGHIWVQRSVPEWLTEEFAFNSVPPVPTTWDVFDPSGAWLGSVDFPERFEVFDLSEDHVTGLWKDDTDVEHVRVYALIKSLD